MAVWRPPVPGILEQDGRNSRSHRFLRFVCIAVTILPFMPGAWAPSAGGFPAMTGTGAFLMKDVVLFAASFYLLKQDLQRVAIVADQTSPASTIGHVSSSAQTVHRTA